MSANGTVLEITDASFEKDVLQSDVPVLLDFWAVWCGPCRAISPLLGELANDYAGKIKVAKMDIDSNKQITAQCRVAGIPTIILFKDGKEFKRHVGVAPKEHYAGMIDEAI